MTEAVKVLKAVAVAALFTRNCVEFSNNGFFFCQSCLIYGSF